MIEQYVLAPAVASAVLAHYERAGDLIVANFPLAPIVPVYFPDGLDKKPRYGGSVHGKIPDSIPTVETGTEDDPRPYIAAAPNSVLWLVHRGASASNRGRRARPIRRASAGMVTPLDWDEVGHIHNGQHTAANSEKRLEHDVFGRLKTELAYQSFASTQR